MSGRWCASPYAASRSPWPRPVQPRKIGPAPHAVWLTPPRPAPRPSDTRRRDAFNLRHHRPAHGDMQTQIVTSAFGATIPHGSANRHPSKPHKPRRFTPQCEKCGLVDFAKAMVEGEELGSNLLQVIEHARSG